MSGGPRRFGAQAWHWRQIGERRRYYRIFVPIPTAWISGVAHIVARPLLPDHSARLARPADSAGGFYLNPNPNPDPDLDPDPGLLPPASLVLFLFLQDLSGAEGATDLLQRADKELKAPPPLRGSAMVARPTRPQIFAVN